MGSAIRNYEFAVLAEQKASKEKCCQICSTLNFAWKISRYNISELNFLGGAFRILNLKILSMKIVFAPQISQQKSRQNCSKMKFTEKI
jgi:hypothetical protein